MQTPSTQLAEILVDRAIAARTTRPRSVPVTCKCETCGGCGTVTVERQHANRQTCSMPDQYEVACSDCDDGVETLMCECLGHGAATTVFFDDDGRAGYFCDSCATMDGLVGDGAAVSFALKVMP